MTGKQLALFDLLDKCLSSSSSSSCCAEMSDSSVLSDEEEMFALVQSSKKRMCIRNYFEKTVPAYSSEEFRRHFRINRELFELISSKFAETPEYKELRDDKKNSTPKHVAVFLWFAGHEACSYREIGDRFDLSLWTVCKMISRVTRFLSNLAEDVVKWPDENKKEEISESFRSKGFSKCIGAIDGTHIEIDPPKRGKDDYIDRKNRLSICLQGICDYRGKFIDICVGFPGSVHDSRVFQNSPIFKKLESLCGDYYILGDSAYPCLKYLLTPYRDNGHLTGAQKNFNKKLSSFRVVIEHAFGILKQRFRQLYHCKLKGMGKLCHFIRACCVLHNLADLDDFEFDPLTTEPNPDDIPSVNAIGRRESMLGKSFRDTICAALV